MSRVCVTARNLKARGKIRLRRKTIEVLSVLTVGAFCELGLMDVESGEKWRERVAKTKTFWMAA